MFKFPIQVKVILTMIFISLIFVSTLKADYLKVGSNYCTLDFYYKNAYLYYHKSNSPDVLQTRDLKGETFLANYTYDADTDRCFKNETFMALGLEEKDYNAYMAFAGLISSLLITSTVVIILKA